MSAHIILDAEHRKTDRLRVSLTIYRRQPRLDVRLWYRDAAGEHKPTRMGVSLNLEQARDVAKALLAGVDAIEAAGAAQPE
ncbi:transcriptional coactivator p15/PC4 family protein [Robbsia andropogonis]|uniref:transcriptional coactivator p15/PC4 family protein n=1 Tax=Robbsia andropogonis TaxID=28092 RepID=UPI00209FA600|nr:transcriptional coactivator p15/PC4 family protein [Robbsia andropogonis]MCP1120494.1 transcriptional coactivator p15/PC4 family protein [Robbsia andropogonis]MCP1131275.1 transcriptional coactivator p15/PC4 family protein [Robbsia andropogonis]